MEIEQIKQGLTERSNYLNLPDKITPEENEILKLKYAGKTFGSMTVQERDVAARHALLRIHVITGWQVPANELMLILIDEFNKKIVESFPNVNAEEITYAFRNKSTDIKNWGTCLSVSLIDEVMLPYLGKRFEISRLEESVKTKQIGHKPDLAKIDQEFEAFKKTPLGKQFFPDGKDI